MICHHAGLDFESMAVCSLRVLLPLAHRWYFVLNSSRREGEEGEEESGEIYFLARGVQSLSTKHLLLFQSMFWIRQSAVHLLQRAGQKSWSHDKPVDGKPCSQIWDIILGHPKSALVFFGWACVTQTWSKSRSSASQSACLLVGLE